jgi:hypothetical protein
VVAENESAHREAAARGGRFINCSATNCGVGVHLGPGVGPNYFENFKFAGNRTDVVSEGAAGQVWKGTKFGPRAAPASEQEKGEKRFGFSQRIKGKVCRTCGYSAFVWQRMCPKGHPL